MFVSIKASARAALAFSMTAVLAAGAQAAQVCLTNAQQARTSTPVATSLRINNPSNVVTCSTAASSLGGAWQTGDFQLAIIALDTNAPIAITPPSASWTLLRTVNANRVQHSIYYKTIIGAPAGFEQFAWAPAVPAIMSIMNFRNVDAANPFADVGSSATGGLAATNIVGPVTPGSANGMQVMLLSHVGVGALSGTSTTPGNVTPAYSTTGCVAGGRCGRQWGSNAGLDADGDGSIGNAAGDERISVAQYVRPAIGVSGPYFWPSTGNSKLGSTMVLRAAP